MSTIELFSDTTSLRPRYNEVDQMGYVYHANYITYCHVARTEMLRKLKIPEKLIESKGIMMPVIEFNIKYKTPAHLDELLTIRTWICKLPKVTLTFHFEITKNEGQIVCFGNSSIAFVYANSRKAVRTPEFIVSKFEKAKENETNSFN